MSNFIEEVKSISVSKLIGKTFSDQKGIFAGRNNDFFYFVDSNQNSRNISWNLASESDGLFRLPTKEELMFLFSTKREFNMNCSENEKWKDGYYWTSEDYKTYAYQVSFIGGETYLKDKSSEFCVRKIYTLNIYKSIWDKS